ncbi:flagellar assembly peptidoglycan hydrolase FlgJ [Hafnia psychrotolerans]|uniref:Peptidoglycan hydrolase FlgJ n=1 Tax=Hafnia psychrotolerans TaxID=1477018 RepID=A0ABQ1FZG2_9GAMM|nr:flagellar assembly peptidoglycan hydrolase FlgJ [Hafnia psychrotolerans]GGA34480.1 flagellar rod assembly protein/muramidase FlgJ [Hafnia psychrotolerans]
MSDLMSMSGAAYETQSLNTLKLAVQKDPQAHIAEVAKQFEGVFVQMMLKSMRSALPQDGLLSSDQTRLYTSMYDQQIAQNMSAKGLGMAEMMVKQMTGGNPEPSEMAGTVPMALDKEVLNTMPVLAMEQMIRKAIPNAPDRTSGGAPLGQDSGQFVSRLSVPAQVASKESGISHQLILAQAALESGWGQREIPTTNGKQSYNLFGIKAGSSWDGPTTNITTTEYTDGVAKKVQASFRVYGSYVEAIGDYVKLLTNNPRYAQVMAAATPEQAAHALQAAGYATDPNYADKLVSVIQKIKGAGHQAVKAYSTDLSKIF